MRLLKGKKKTNSNNLTRSFKSLFFFFICLILLTSLVSAQLNINFKNGEVFEGNISLRYSQSGFVPYVGAAYNVDLGMYNITADWGHMKIDWSNIQNVPSGNITNTMKNTSGPYLYNNTWTIFFNDTILNNTIDERTDDKLTDYVPYNGGTNNLVLTGYNISSEWINASIDWSNLQNVPAGFQSKLGGGPYLYNDSSTIYLNETFLNSTIEDKIAAYNLTVNASLQDFVPYDGAHSNVNLSDKNISAYMGNFTEIYVSNNSIHIGNVTLSSRVEGNRTYLDIPGVYVNTTAYIGDGGFLSNISFEGGNLSTNGTINAAEFNGGDFYGELAEFDNVTADNVTAILILVDNITGDSADFIVLNADNIITDNVTADNFYGGNFTGDWGFMKINWSSIQNVPSVFTNTQKNASGPYLYNDTLTIYLNETKLNETISDLNVDTNTEKNGSGHLYNDSSTIYLNETLLNNTIENKLNISLNNTLSYYVPYVGGFNNLVLTGYNITADFIFGTVDWSQLVGVPMFITSIATNPYIYLNGTEIGFNETNLNATIDDRQIDTRMNTSGPYLYNDTITIYFNSTFLNATIDDRDTNTHSFTEGLYLYNNTSTIFYNESKLNDTIRDLAVVGPYNKTIQINVSGGVGTNLTSSIQYQITEIIVIPPGTGNYRFQAAEYATGTIIDADRKVHVGIWDIYKNHQIADQQVQTNITGTNGLYTVTIKYIGQFE